MEMVVSNEGCFQSFEGLLPQVGRGSFGPYKFVLEPPPPRALGVKTTTQMHCNESRGYLRPEVEERALVCTCGSWSVSP